MVWDFLIGFFLSAAIAGGAYWKKSLTLDGAIAAAVTGAFIYLFGGIYFYALLMGFFISSSLLSKIKSGLKEEAEKLHSKSGSRDYTQVLVNTLPAVAYGALYYGTGNTAFLVAYASLFAAANADTWGSELGVLSRKMPVSIITFREIPRGLSGGVSQLGTLASLLGALFLALFFLGGYILSVGFSAGALFYTLIVAAAGFAGSLLDSLLGATVQAKYRTLENRLTERRYHRDGENRLVSGFHFITNNAVNILSALGASFLALAGSLLLF